MLELARTLQAMGLAEFTAAWRQAFNNEPPLEELLAIVAKLDA